MSWKKVKLGDLLTESRIPCDNPNPDRRIKVKLKVLGVEKRGVENEIEGATKQFIRKAGQFIYGKQNFHKGAFGIIPKELDGFESSADLPAFDVSEKCLPEWIFYYFKQGNYYLELSKIARGVATQRIHPEQIYDLEIPLPDLKTQKNVLSKIESLEESGTKISTELAHQLTLVKKLRQQLLQDAVQGKLVEQSRKLSGPKDEPASELLKKIKAEKQKLIAEKKTKSEFKLHQKSKMNPPYELPDNWEWVRFWEIAWCFRGHNPAKIHFKKEPGDGYVRFIQITDFKTDDQAVYVPMSKQLKLVTKGEIVMAAYRHIGKFSREMEGAFNVALCKVNNIEPFSRDFLSILIKSDLISGELLAASERGHIPSMHTEHLLSLWVPVPPLSEQNRIVQKLDELMQYCNELEASIKESQVQNEKLLQQVLREALRKEPVEA